jgi:hypothetical protein
MINLSPNDRAALAQDHKTSPEELNSLAQDEHYIIRSLVAENKNTSKEALESLAKDPIRLVRWYVALNRNTPENILIEMFRDGEFKDLVIKNANCPAILKIFS